MHSKILSRTPAALQSFLGGVTDPWIRGVEGPDTFSAFDVVGHLIDGEETDWMERARIILDRGPDPRFTPYDRFRHRGRNVDDRSIPYSTSSRDCGRRISSRFDPGSSPRLISI